MSRKYSVVWGAGDSVFKGGLSEDGAVAKAGESSGDKCDIGGATGAVWGLFCDANISIIKQYFLIDKYIAR